MVFLLEGGVQKTLRNRIKNKKLYFAQKDIS